MCCTIRYFNKSTLTSGPSGYGSWVSTPSTEQNNTYLYFTHVPPYVTFNYVKERYRQTHYDHKANSKHFKITLN